MRPYLLALLLPAAASAATVERLELEATRTRPAVLRRLVGTREGGAFDARRWKDDVRRLADTGRFYEVAASTAASGGGVRARIAAKNKFSTIPILKFKRGGGTSALILGLYEVNLARTLIETGAQYESFNGRPGGALWLRHPYFPTRRDRFGADLLSRTVSLPLLRLTGEREADFENEETRVNLHYTRELRSPLSAGLTASFYRNVFRRDDSTPEKTARNAVFGQAGRLDAGRTVSLSPRLAFGRLRTAGASTRGLKAELGGEWSWRGLGSQYDFIRGTLRLSGGAEPRPGLNIVSQFTVGAKTGEEFQHKFYLGGLDSIRGFLDGQFRGNHMWLWNAEVRPTLIDRGSWVVQGNLFTDWAKTWDESAFDLNGFKAPFLSHGLGVRLILPKVYRAVLRVDVAWTREPVRRTGFSLGLQQFF